MVCLISLGRDLPLGKMQIIKSQVREVMESYGCGVLDRLTFDDIDQSIQNRRLLSSIRMTEVDVTPNFFLDLGTWISGLKKKSLRLTLQRSFCGMFDHTGKITPIRINAQEGFVLIVCLAEMYDFSRRCISMEDY